MKNKKIFIPLLAVIILVAAIIGISSSGAPTVDLGEYIRIDGVDGLNGQGVLRYSFDAGAMYDDLISENKDLQDINNWNEDELTRFYTMFDCINLTASPEYDLSNGDKATVSATFENTTDMKFDFRFKDGKLDYTVEGLMDGKPFDPFSEDVLSLSFTGASGSGKAQLDILSDEEPYCYVSYVLSKDKNLSTGDTVTVSIEYSETNLESAGYLLPFETEKEYTVSGLKDYISSFSDIPADMIAQLKAAAPEAFKAEAENTFSSTLTDYSISHVYFADRGEENGYLHDSWNGLHLRNALLLGGPCTLYSERWDEEDHQWLFYVCQDWMISDDGAVSFNESNIPVLSGKITDDRTMDSWLRDVLEDTTLSVIE